MIRTIRPLDRPDPGLEPTLFSASVTPLIAGTTLFYLPRVVRASTGPRWWARAGPRLSRRTGYTTLGLPCRPIQRMFHISGNSLPCPRH